METFVCALFAAAWIAGCWVFRRLWLDVQVQRRKHEKELWDEQYWPKVKR